MATIELSTKQVNERIVVAYDPRGGNASRKGGNVEVTTGDALEWQCANEGQAFLVRFYRFATDQDVWPFSQQPDKTTPGPNPTRYLRVNSKTVKSRTVTSTQSLKYEVEVESGPAAEPLDPMIIIRPAQIAADSVLLGATCAVLGAAVGALVVWAL